MTILLRWVRVRVRIRVRGRVRLRVWVQDQGVQVGHLVILRRGETFDELRTSYNWVYNTRCEVLRNVKCWH